MFGKPQEPNQGAAPRPAGAPAAGRPQPANKEERYRLEMTFSRGQSNGWLSGTNHPQLTHGKWGKKRGPAVGVIAKVLPERGQIRLTERTKTPIKAGDGFVIDEAAQSVDRNKEQGGTAFRVKGEVLTFDKRNKLDWFRIQEGQTVYKTSDPALEREISSEWKSARPAEKGQDIKIKVSGQVGELLKITCGTVSVTSGERLEAARTKPWTQELVEAQLSKLGGTGYSLEGVECSLAENVALPMSMLNRTRRALVSALDIAKSAQQREMKPLRWQSFVEVSSSQKPKEKTYPSPSLRVLCRDLSQIEAALECGVSHLYADFEDIRLYKDAVRHVRDESSETAIALATARIQKSGEQGYFKLIERADPDGVLVRNLGAIDYFSDSSLTRYGDFSLNVANPLTAQILQNEGGLDSLTISYDLNLAQVLDLLQNYEARQLELSLHHHMPMFHMEHCVFCTFMSEGTSYKDCGRPCEKHSVELRDRVGQKHILMADVGCRNTLFNGRAQTGVRHYHLLKGDGLGMVRLELLKETKSDAITLIRHYQNMIKGSTTPEELLPLLSAQDRLGITEGTLEKRRQEVHL